MVGIFLRKSVVEAAGVELIRVLTARKLLILRMARGAKKAPLPIPLYVYCTKILSRFRLQLADHRASIPQLCPDRKSNLFTQTILYSKS